MIGPRGGTRLVLLAAVVAASGEARAKEVAHVVRSGESASSLAKRYYGDHELGETLLRFNGKSGTVLRTGERLTIPFCDVHTTRPGDTWSKLAQRHLGRAAAGSVLAELNGLVPEKPLRVGERIVVPVVVRHTLRRGDTLASLAERFYGDRGKTRILQEFGRIEDAKRLSVGTVVEIPLTGFRGHDPDPADTTEAPVAQTPPAPEPAVTRRFEGPLAEAERSFAGGEYDRARASLEAIRGAVAAEGTPADRRELARLLAFVYVAFDLDDDACRAYRSAPLPEGEAPLDPDLVSPRIREALSSCPTPPPEARGLDASGSAAQI